MKRLMIVADNSFAAQSIRLALRQTAGFQVIGFVDGTVELSPRLAELQPDLVVIDDMHEPEHAVARLAGDRHAPAGRQARVADAPHGRGRRSTRRSTPAPTRSSRRPSTPSASPRCCARSPATPSSTVRAARRRSRRRRLPADRPRTGDPAARRAGLHQRPDRPRAVGHRADGQVPPLEHVPQARRRQPHRGQPLRARQRPHGRRLSRRTGHGVPARARSVRFAGVPDAQPSRVPLHHVSRVSGSPETDACSRDELARTTTRPLDDVARRRRGAARTHGARSTARRRTRSRAS